MKGQTINEQAARFLLDRFSSLAAAEDYNATTDREEAERLLKAGNVKQAAASLTRAAISEATAVAYQAAYESTVKAIDASK